MEIFTREFMKLYGGDQLPPLRFQYKDFSEWKNSEKEQAAAAYQETYWLQEFTGEIPVLNLPVDYPRPVIQDFEGSVCRFEIEARQVEALRRCALEQGVTLYMVLLSLYTLLLSKLSNQEDIVVGTPVAGRQHPDLQTIIGMFVKTLALRNYPWGAVTFKHLLGQVKERCLEAFAHQDYPYEELVEALPLARDTSRNPLFDTMFVLQNLDITRIEIPGMELKNYNGFENPIAKFDLMLTIIENGPRLACNFEYCTKLFKAETIQRFTRYFMRIVSEVPGHLDFRLSRFEIITEVEKKQILEKFNNTRLEICRGKTIHELFAEQADRTPNAIAAKDADYLTVISYGELNKRADRLASFLRENSITIDTVVGVLMERRLELMIALLGILKAGGAYLPIVPYLPMARQQYIARESAVSLVLCHKKWKLEFPDEERQVRFIRLEEVFLEERNQEKESSLPSYFHPQNTAYVIYTSGSTGKPKGVMIEHAQLVNFVFHMVNRFNGRLGPGDNCLSLTEISFDVSVGELFLPLPFGASIVFLAEESKYSGRELARVILEQTVTFAYIPPGLLPEVSAALKEKVSTFKLSLDKMLVGVEPIRDSVLEEYMKLNPVMRLLNGYGPTEATICATMLTYESHPPEGKIVPIGPPLSNMQVLILDKGENLVPVNIPGELCISGNGVGRGYLNNPELTAEKFDQDLLDYQDYQDKKKANPLIKNYKLQNTNYKQITNYKLQITNTKETTYPQYPIPPLPHSPIYRTGDLAKWLESGSIQFMGRIDQQVKVKGYRIEPGEIENQLLGQKDIKKARVIVRQDDGNEKYLCGYIAAEKEINIPILKKELSKHLPDYMVPTYILQVEAIPVTPHGKLDLQALPVPGRQGSVSYAAPRCAVEEKLVDIWTHVLHLQGRSVGIDDDFFELGGHSLKATILTAEIHKVLEVRIPLTEIFRRPTIRELSEYISETRVKEYTGIENSEVREYYPLSSAQKRLYILHQVAPNGIGYNIPIITRLEGEIEPTKLEDCFWKLLCRHESLRTSFVLIDEEPFQEVHAEVDFKIDYYDLATKGTKGTEGTEDKITLTKVFAGGPGGRFFQKEPPWPPEALIKNFIRPFDLSRAPLFRVGLIKLSPTPASQEGVSILMVDMHHIVSDGMSIGIFVKEFVELYAGKELPALRLQYKDYSEWQHRQSIENPMEQQEAYWLKEFAGEAAVLELPTDYPRPAVQDFTGSSITFEIGGKETNALKALTNEQGVTLFMLLLSFYIVCLSSLSGQEDIVVGTPIAGRRHADLEHLMGMFVNTLALRNFPCGQKPFIQFLEEIKENTVKAFENQDYLYEDLVEQVAVKRDMGRNPLFDTMFVLQNFDAFKIEIPGLKVQTIDYETRISKFDLTLTAVEKEENLLFIFEYCTKLFRQETIRRFIGYFTKIISNVIQSPGLRISEIEIIGEEEKNCILHEFNDTAAEYPKDKTIHGLFEEQVERTPDHVALVGKEEGWKGRRVEAEKNYKIQNTNYKQIGAFRADINAFGEAGLRAKSQELIAVTYKELNEKSNGLAYYLIEKSVIPDSIVGIMVERSVEMVFGILAVLKAGGAYMPIDPEYPEERKKYMLKDSNAEILLTSQDIPGLFSPQALYFSEGRNFTNDQCPMTNDRLAYIIYTSGSTGKPKGVLVEHDAVVNLLFALHHRYPFRESDTYMLKTSYLFDVSVTELFGWFLEGGRLAVLEPGGEKDPGAILDMIEREGVTHINFVPSMFYAFVEILASREIVKLVGLKYIFLAGEALLPAAVNRFRSLNTSIAIENIYGPTEAVVYASWFSLAGWDGEGAIPIGKPLPNVNLYILDKLNSLQPIGVVGQLCIGGTGLARGYLNRSGLTAEKFINPSPITHYSSPIYNTGDLARWLCDGNIEFLGRIDHQVKIRGFRIELGEIEHQLLTHEKIREAIVLAREDNNDKNLCAYIVAKSGETNPIDQPGLREHLSSRLPAYMVPSYFVQLDRLPLTANGKIDRKALPLPMIEVDNHFAPPENELQENLVETWSDVMGIEKEKISIDANFFELGGNSLKAVLLIAAMNKRFNIDLPGEQVFKNPTIRGIAFIIDALGWAYNPRIDTRQKREEVIL